MSLLPALILTLTIISLSPNPSSSLSIFPAGTLLSGDAHSTAGQHSIQLTSGIILNQTPFNFSQTTSFSSNFTFQIGNSISLILIPYNLTETTSFNALNDKSFIKIEYDVTSRVRVSNVSKISSELKEGVKLATWIDYHAVLRRLEVRVSKLGVSRPDEAVVSYHVNLVEMLRGEEVLFGLVAGMAGNGKGKVSSVYSWWCEVKDVPKWMHSVAADPRDYVKVKVGSGDKKKGCFLSGVLYVTGCGALVSLVLLFVWLYVADRQSVKVEDHVSPVEFKYEKIGVVGEKDMETGVTK